MREGSIEELFVRDRPMLMRCAMKLLRHEDDAEDAVASAFLKLLRHKGQFEGRSKFSSYANKVVQNECFMLMRTNGRAHKWGRICHETLVGKDHVAPVERDAHGHRMALFMDALQRLSSEPLREAVETLLHTDSVKEGAAVLGINLNAYKTRLSRARRELRKLIDADADRAMVDRAAALTR